MYVYVPFLWGFPGGSEGKASACNAGDLGLIPGLGRSPGEENGNPLQYSCLENPMDREAWQATVHGVANSWMQLRDFTFTFTSYHFFIRSSLDEPLVCFHVFIIINSAAVTMGCVYLFELEFLSFINICPRVGLLDHMITVFLDF